MVFLSVEVQTLHFQAVLGRFQGFFQRLGSGGIRGSAQEGLHAGHLLLGQPKLLHGGGHALGLGLVGRVKVGVGRPIRCGGADARVVQHLHLGRVFVGAVLKHHFVGSGADHGPSPRVGTVFAFAFFQRRRLHASGAQVPVPADQAAFFGGFAGDGPHFGAVCGIDGCPNVFFLFQGLVCGVADHVEAHPGTAAAVLPLEHGVALETDAVGLCVDGVVGGGNGKSRQGALCRRSLLLHPSAQGFQVIQNPRRASKGAQDQVLFPGLQGHVLHRHGGNALPFLPALPFVGAHVQAGFGTQVEQVGHVVVLHHAQRVALDPAGRRGQVLPGFSVVRGVKEVRGKVVLAVVVHDHPRFSCLVRAGVDVGNPRPAGHSGHPGGAQRPGFSAVAGDVDLAVVGPRPKRPFFQGRRGNGQQAGVVFGTGYVPGESAAFQRLVFLGVVGGQVRGNDLPALAAVGAKMHVLRAVVNGVWGKGILGNGRVPVEAQVFAFGMHRLDKVRVPGGEVHPSQVTFLGHGVGRVGVRGVRNDVESVAKVQLLPLGVANACVFEGVGRAAPRSVVLHPSVDVVGHCIVHADVVELRQGQVFDKPPG